MSRRPAPLTQSDAKRRLKAALDAGWGRAVIHPDGRIEVIAEANAIASNTSPSDEWDRELLK